MKWIKTGKHDDDTLKPGSVFEKYTVVKQLGQGGMGSVYLVRHDVLDSLFALKILSSDVASKNKQFVDRFIREAKLACKIRHPNLIAVHDAGKNPKNGMYYIVMDYVSGGSVRDLLKKTQRIPPDRALEIITQVADALTAACAHHMVHRDIKPDNIMFAADGSVKLADLGIAKSTDEQDTMITMAASVFGTPAYMSPEQAKDSSKVDSRADIYSLGIVFFEMLSGQRPFSGTTAIQILSQVMDASGIPDIRQICPDAPPDLALLISRMAEKSLEKRIPSPDVLLQELRKIRIPPQIAGRPLRTRDEIAASGPAAQMPDVTMPTMATVAESAPAPAEETMPTMATVAEVAPSAPEEPVVAPAAPVPAPSVPAPAPSVPVPAAAASVPAPAAHASTPSTPAPADVTMPTMATVAEPAPVTSTPAAPATAPSAPATAPSAPVATATAVASPPPAQKKGKRGILPVCSIAAVCLVFVIGALLAVVFLFGGGASSEPVPKTDPGQANGVSRTDTPPGGTPVADSRAVVIQPSPGGGPDPRRPSEAGSGSGADVPHGTGQAASADDAPAVRTQAIIEEMTPDPLGKNQIVLLADTSAASRKTKGILAKGFGAENVSFQEAEGMARYKQLVRTIIQSDPSLVVICFARQYAEDGVSASGYETVIGYHADQFQDEGIPCLFIQPVEDDDGDVRLKPFLDATMNLCRQRSIPFIGEADLTDGTLVPLVRENKKAE